MGTYQTSPFANNSKVKYFEELRFFTSITSLPRWSTTKFQKVKFPPHLRTIDYYTGTWGESPILDFPSSLTTIQLYFWLRLSSNPNRILILRSETPPSVTDSNFNAAKIGTLYVPSAYRAAYEAHSVWGRLSAKMADLEGSAYEVFNEWEF